MGVVEQRLPAVVGRSGGSAACWEEGRWCATGRGGGALGGGKAVHRRAGRRWRRDPGRVAAMAA